MSSILESMQRLLETVRAQLFRRNKPKLLATEYANKSQTATLKVIWQIARTAIKALVALSLVLGLIVAGTWAILVGTIVSFPSLSDERLVVQRSTWPLGDAPIGEVVAGTLETRPSDFFSRIAFEINATPQNSLSAAIIARPGDTVETTQSGRILVNGESTRFTSDRNIKPVQMTEEYLALCIDGACGTPGTPFELQIDQVIGSIKGTVSQAGIERYDVSVIME